MLISLNENRLMSSSFSAVSDRTGALSSTMLQWCWRRTFNLWGPWLSVWTLYLIYHEKYVSEVGFTYSYQHIYHQSKLTFVFSKEKGQEIWNLHDVFTCCCWIACCSCLLPCKYLTSLQPQQHNNSIQCRRTLTQRRPHTHTAHLNLSSHTMFTLPVKLWLLNDG